MDTLATTSVIHCVNQLLLDAVTCGASDIHFEPYESHYRVRYRQDGLLREVTAPSLNLMPNIVARIKVLANLDIAERRLPQDGRFQLPIAQNQTIDFRVSSCPTLHGEKIVVRILNSAPALFDLAKLGMTAEQQALFLNAIERSQGLILVCGATGSGKTVTLYSALNHLNTIEKNISTVEDPVEITLSGINQVPINPRAGLNFSTVLRALLRQDPDVMMVGEIRDLETADIAVRAAQTGHLVLSTLHTNSAQETLARLTNMGVSTLNIASSLSLVVAQRLVRKLCECCKKKADYSTAALLQEGFSSDEIPNLSLYRAVGCEHCLHGFKGREGIFQVLPIAKTLAQNILSGDAVSALTHFSEHENVWDLRQSGLEKVRAGITSLEELNRVWSQSDITY